MKLRWSIFDFLILLSAFGIIAAWVSIPKTPNTAWNTTFFPYVPMDAPKEYADNGRVAPTRNMGASYRWTEKYRNGVDLFQTYHARGWANSVSDFLNDDYERLAHSTRFARKTVHLIV